MDLNPMRFGLAGGILWGVVTFVMTWLSLFTGYGAMWLALMSDIYPGFDVSVIGSFIGLAYGFVDGFVALYVIAWLYNHVKS